LIMTHDAINGGKIVSLQVHGTRINGIFSPPGTASFLGIPFAKFPQRFRSATLLNLDDFPSDLNATAYGPRCPQPHNAGRERRKHLFKGITPASTFPMSEFDCLRLNIYAPWESYAPSEKLPVLVWIHGGGWIFGDGNSEYGSQIYVSTCCSTTNRLCRRKISRRQGSKSWEAIYTREPQLQAWISRVSVLQRIARRSSSQQRRIHRQSRAKRSTSRLEMGQCYLTCIRLNKCSY
jgi:Carboxylesterase family